jgi:hypothetical protein
MAKVSGMVYRSGSKEGIPYATIKASKGAQVYYTTANKVGEFELEIPEPGSWELIALEKKSYASDPLSVSTDQDQADIKLIMDRIAETSDDKAGRMFFWILVGVFGLLIILYLLVHLLLPAPGQAFKIWPDDPLRFLEIILWGLGGIVVSKIITIGWYLRGHRFYKEGIIMHIAHIISTPILVLVIVLLLSQVTLKFTLANTNEIALDLSVPTVMVAFAFIIGTSPWPLWNFILNTAKRFTGQLEKSNL